MPPNVVAQEIANEKNTESNEASFEQQVAELSIGSVQSKQTAWIVPMQQYWNQMLM